MFIPPHRLNEFSDLETDKVANNTFAIKNKIV